MWKEIEKEDEEEAFFADCEVWVASHIASMRMAVISSNHVTKRLTREVLLLFIIRFA